MTKWQPIETAPQTKKLLLFFPEGKPPRGAKRGLPPMMAIGRPNAFPFRPPTHWMHLPSPPAQDK